MNDLFGMSVIVDENAVEIPWIFPTDPFVEYESSDEWWARKYRFGKGGKAKPCAYQIGRQLIVHPVIYEAMKKELG